MKKRILLKVMFLLCAGLIAPVFATASSPAVKQTSHADIERIMNFWNGLKYIKGKIVQKNGDDSVIAGDLWVKKAKGNAARLRLDYEKDAQQRLFVINGEVRLQDLSDGSTSVYPVSMTPADLILKPNLKLGKDVKLLSANRTGHKVEFQLAMANDENSGSITLYFDLHSGIQLEGWKIVDSQNVTTEVLLAANSLELNNPKVVPDSLFQ